VCACFHGKKLLNNIWKFIAVWCRDVNVKTATKRLLKAPFRALGMDLVRWRPPKPQPVIPPEELEMIAAFSPQYKPEDHWFATSGIKTVLGVGAHMGRVCSTYPGNAP